jgi:hypothetical protein
MGLFKEEAGKVVLNLEIKTIPQFAALIRYDKTRTKSWAQTIFEFIYMVYDFRSPYQIYTFSQREHRLKEQLGIDEKDLKLKVVKSAIDCYIELSETPLTRTLVKTKETLLTSVDVLDKIRQRIENVMTQEEIAADDLANTLTLITRSLSLAEQIPKNVKMIEDLEDRIRKDMSGGSRIRGGGEINEFEK